MIEYFGRHSCKQAIRNKPIWFRFQARTLPMDILLLLNYIKEKRIKVALRRRKGLAKHLRPSCIFSVNTLRRKTIPTTFIWTIYLPPSHCFMSLKPLDVIEKFGSIDWVSHALMVILLTSNAPTEGHFKARKRLLIHTSQLSLLKSYNGQIMELSLWHLSYLESSTGKI